MKAIAKLYKENLTENRLAELDHFITLYAQSRKDGEHFGDFVIRHNVVQISKRRSRLS